LIVIYTPKVTNRIKYTADFVFSQYFGMQYVFTENPDISIVSDNLYLNYSKNRLANFYNIFQDDLLLENDIRLQKIFVSREAAMPVFFQTTENFDMRFDIFSCIFFLLSRYEEYLPHDKDIHGRYKSTNSILAKPEFNFSPIVETWLHFLKQELLKINSSLEFKKYEFEYLPTFDIDNAFRYLGRNWLKHPPNIFEVNCWKTLLGKQTDPFDVYDKILNETKKYDLNKIFFFLLSDEGENNSKVSPESKKLKKIIQYISSHSDIGLHPSYHSLDENNVAGEYHKLYQIANRNVYHTRQHFLRISYPELIKNMEHTNALEIDYSLMYPDVVGFRAGISRPFSLFDLFNNKTSSILLQPSCWMDATYAYYQPLNNDEIQHNFLTLFNQLRQINGKLVAIFHNDLLAMEKYWGVFRFINNQTNSGDEK
jgi:hypothetical protein